MMNDTASTVRTGNQRVASQSRSGLSQWMRSPAGVEMLRTEVDRVHAAVGNLFGYHCLQVGDLAGADLMSASRILGRTVVDIDGGAPRCPYPIVSAAATSLPVDSHAVDVVILPHVLEFEPHPHEALREASRVLVPEGSLVILGFNPVSVIGLRRVFRYRAEVAPWCGTYFGSLCSDSTSPTSVPASRRIPGFVPGDREGVRSSNGCLRRSRARGSFSRRSASTPCCRCDRAGSRGGASPKWGSRVRP